MSVISTSWASKTCAIDRSTNQSINQPSIQIRPSMTLDFISMPLELLLSVDTDLDTLLV